MKVQQIVTNEIIKELENGSNPWLKTWNTLEQINFKSKKRYSGINQLILSLQAKEKEYKSNLWLTFNQAKSINGNLKGEKSTPIIFYKMLKVEDQDKKNEEKEIPMMRYYRVFNLDQVKGSDLKESEKVIKETEKLESEEIINKYTQREDIRIIKSSASIPCYNPLNDEIQMPTMDQFNDKNNYQEVLFHEITHSTGHPDRLKRFNLTETYNSDKESYSLEELVAELGSLMLCKKAGIKPNYKNSSAYIKSWLKALKNDQGMIIKASSKADKSTAFILE